MPERLTARQTRFAALCIRCASPDYPIRIARTRVGGLNRGFVRATTDDDRVPPAWRACRPLISYGWPFSLLCHVDGSEWTGRPAVLIWPACPAYETRLVRQQMIVAADRMTRHGVHVQRYETHADYVAGLDRWPPPPDVAVGEELLPLARHAFAEAWEKMPLDFLRPIDPSLTLPRQSPPPTAKELGAVVYDRGRPKLDHEGGHDRYSPRDGETWADLDLAAKRNDPHLDLTKLDPQAAQENTTDGDI